MNQILSVWLNRYRKEWWTVRLWKLYSFTLPLAAFFTSIIILLESILNFSTKVRVFLFASLVLIWIVPLLFPFLWFFISYLKKNPSDYLLAKDFQRRPKGNGRLLNALELMQDTSELSQYAIELVEQELSQMSVFSLFTKDQERLRFFQRTILAMIFLGIIVILPQGGQAVARLLMPTKDFGPKSPYQLIWDENDSEFARNEPIERILRIKVITAPPTTFQGVLKVQEEGVRGLKTYPIVFIGDSAIVRSEPRMGKVTFIAKLGNIESPPLELTPFHRVRLENVMYTLQPPLYTGLPPSISTGGNLTVLPGTRIEFQANVVGNVSQLFGVFRNDTIGIKLIGKKASSVFTITQSGTLNIILKDLQNRNGLFPTPLYIQLSNDEIPIVQLLTPEKDQNIPGNLRFPVIGRAEDDFGIAKMYLVYRFGGNRPIGDWDSLSLPLQTSTNTSSQTSVFCAIEWDVTRYDLLPDDWVEFYLSAFDENNITGPNRGVSVLRKMLVPSLEKWFQESEALHTSISGDLQSLSQSGQLVAKSLEELAQKLKRKGELNYEEREKMRGTLEKQLQLAEQVEKTAKELRELSQKLEESGTLAQQTLEKISKLQELMNELASPELKQALQELQEALKKMDQNQIRAAMEKFQLSQKEWLEKLDRTLSLLEQIRLERRLDMLEKWSKQVAEQARRNQMQTDTLKSEHLTDSLSQVYSKLANESKSLEQQVSATAEDAKKSPYFDQNDIQDMSHATQPNQAASVPLQQTAKQFSQDLQNAKMTAREAARRAEALAQKIANWNKQLREKSKQDVSNKIQRRIGELLQLSKLQMDLQQQYTPLDVRTPQARSLAEQQEAIRRNLLSVIDSLATLGKETFFLPRGLNSILLRADQMMVQSRNLITERMGGAQFQQEQARAAMNEAAAHLMQALGDLEKSNSSTGYEEMMQALAEMARRQAQLNDQTNQMMGEGGLPMPDGTPMDLSGGSMPGGTDGLLQQLAAEQGALANMMKGLEQQSERMRELTSRLQGLSEEMSEVEKQLQDKLVSERTQRLQQRILTRLLDAQRSLQKQDYTQKRESKTGQSIGGRVTIEYDPKMIENSLRGKLLEMSRMGLEPVWQQRIREYWQYFEVSSKPDTTR
ncbi:MAG: hypothetical protein N2450_08475 [bacterium]|nr:hypothetical protein [bacterium]